MYKRTMSLVLGLVLLVVLLQGIQPVQAEAAAEKLTISILGDSISTFPDYSNGTAANTTNSTITNGATYYPLGDVSTVENTWWYKAAKAMNAEILVNNSWSGSRISSPFTWARTTLIPILPPWVAMPKSILLR